jgi:tetratricopeptide (TPR) repeat protein
MAADAWEAWLDSSGMHTEDPAEAIHHLQVLGQGDRAWPIVHKYTASLRNRGQFREARDILRRCESTGTTGDRLAQALRFLAQMLMSLGEHGPEPANLLDRAFMLAESPRTRALVIHETGVLLSDQGDLKRSESVLRHALDLADQLPEGLPILERIAWEETLATVIERSGRLDEAEQIFRRSPALQKNAGVPEDSIQSALIRFSLGRLLVMQKQYPEAETLLRTALAVVGRLLAESHPSYTATLHFLGKALEGQGKYLEAEDLLRRASSVEARLDQKHPDAALNDHSLAQVLLAQGRISEAEALLREALALKEKAHGSEHLETLVTKQTLAVALDLQEKLYEAERLLREVLASFEKLAGPNHPESAGVLHELASVLLKKGQIEEAESLHWKALGLAEASRGRRHPECSVHLHSLANVLVAQGRYREAEELLRRALSINEGSLPPNHPVLGHLFHGLARALAGQGHLAEAESLYRRSLAITEEIDKDHPEVFPSLVNLADIVLQQNRVGEAESLIRRALQVALQSSGPISGPAGAALTRLAFLEARLGRPEASATARRALEALAASSNRDTGIERDLQAIAQDSWRSG